MKYLAITLLLSCCAFKEEEKLFETRPSAILQGTRLAEVSWETEDGAVTLKRTVVGSGNFSLPDPITLPVNIPDKIQLSFNTPLVSDKLLQEPRVSISDQTDEKSIGTPLRLKGMLGPSGIEISGLKTFFAANKPQKGVVQVVLLNAVTGNQEASLGLILVSAPLFLTSSLIKRNAVRDAEIKKLVAPEMRLDLLAILQLKNTNPNRVEFTLPSELNGTLRKDYVRHDFADRGCHTDTGIITWSDSYEARFFVFPLYERIAEEWITHLEDKERAVTLNPGEEVNLGIYGLGNSLVGFVDNGVPFSAHAQVQAVMKCERECREDSYDGWMPDTLAREFPGREHHRSCRDIKIYGTVPTGIDTVGAYWQLEDISTKLRARNAFISRADDPVFRELSFLEARFDIF